MVILHYHGYIVAFMVNSYDLNESFMLNVRITDDYHVFT